MLDAIFRAEPVGTLFLPHNTHHAGVEALAGLHGPAARPLVVDAGARQAVQHQGRSLLPIGMVQVDGTFGKGDVVALCDAEGVEFARGLTNYSSADAERIRGLRSEQMREVSASCL